MSITLMSAVFQSTTLGPTERLVLLSLADHANKAGTCYPSVARLCQRTGLKERTVQIHLKRLEAQGYLRVRPHAGRNGTNLFYVTPCPLEAPPLPDAPSRSSCASPPHLLPSDPAAAAPKPSRTINEPAEGSPYRSPALLSPPKYPLPADWALSAADWAYAQNQSMTDLEITDEARGFHAYWSDRATRKSQRGWAECWASWCRRNRGRSGRSTGVSLSPFAPRHGGLSSLASIAARRRLEAGY